VKPKTGIEALTLYPIENTAFTSYAPDNSVSPHTRLPEITANLRQLVDKGTLVFSARLREIRGADGHVYDPWNRSITGRPNMFMSTAKPIISKNVSPLGWSLKLLLVWLIGTTLADQRVMLAIWEEAGQTLSGSASADADALDRFLERVDPYNIDMSTIYDI
jgi:hypothetical protein